MTTTVGAGDSRYEERHDWPRLPEGWSFREVVDVAVDGQDRVCVFNRGQQPVMVFEADGTLAGAWGEGMFTRPHGLTAGPDGALWAADDDGHCVRRFTWDGELQLTIGIPGQGAEPHSGEPFNRPTKVAVAPRSGEIYIADGYGNARVHKYSPEGEHLLSWGEFGTGPGQFNLVHSVCTDDAGRVFVADRENHRVQIFDDQGPTSTSGTTCTGPAASWSPATGSTSDSCPATSTSTPPTRTSAPASPSTTSKATSSPASAAPTPARGRGSTRRPTVWPSTRGETCTWARSPGAPGAGAWIRRGWCAASASWSGCEGERRNGPETDGQP